MVIVPVGEKVVYVKEGEYYWLESIYGEFDMVKCVGLGEEGIFFRPVDQGDAAPLADIVVRPGEPSDKWIYPIERPHHAYTEPA